MMINNKKRENGFTLIEMLVSVAIVTIGVMGVFSAIAKYSQQAQQERENLIAAYLAQEGIEIVKNIRDTNWVEGAPTWSDGLTAWAAGAEASYGDTALKPYSSDDYLYIKNSTGLYEYLSGAPQAGDIKTPYRRIITITPVSTPENPGEQDELDIVVQVYWTNVMTLEEHIYNWKP